MNQRIRELAEQAGINIDSFQFSGTPIKHIVDEPSLEKFAELIIRDCASLCEIESRSYTYSFTPAKARLAESTAKHCAHIIKRHFGVEE